MTKGYTICFDCGKKLWENGSPQNRTILCPTKGACEKEQNIQNTRYIEIDKLKKRNIE